LADRGPIDTAELAEHLQLVLRCYQQAEDRDFGGSFRTTRITIAAARVIQMP